MALAAASRTGTNSSELISEIRNPPSTVSQLGIHIVHVVIDGSIPLESTRYKVIRIFCYIIGTVASGAGCIIPAYIALEYDHTNKDMRVIDIGGIVGVAIDFGIFAVYGNVLLTRRLVQQFSMSSEHRRLFRENISTKWRVVHIGASTVWALCGRTQALGLAIKFASGIKWGIPGFVGGTGLAIWSAFQTLSHGIDKAKDRGFFCEGNERELRQVRRSLARCLAQCKQAVLKMTPEERRNCLQVLFRDSSENGPVAALTRIQLIFTEIMEINQTHGRADSEACLTFGLRVTMKVGMMAPAAAVMVQMWFLIFTFTSLFSKIPALDGTFAALFISSYLYMVINESLDFTDYFFNKFAGCFVSVNNTQTIAETVFPRLNILFDILGLGLALLPYSELISVSQAYADQDTILDNSFVYGSFAGWTVILFQSVRRLLITNLVRLYAQSDCANEDTRHMMVLITKLEQIEAILQESNLRSLEQLRAELPDLPCEETPLISKENLSAVQ
jgi:hypothetical protein